MNMRKNERICCRDCGKLFIIGEEEAAFFEENGLQKPARCLECRKVRKLERRGVNAREHAAQCAECGYAVYLPFEPTPGRDYFCADCRKEARDEPREKD